MTREWQIRFPDGRHPKKAMFPKHGLVVQLANGMAGGPSTEWVDSIPVKRLSREGLADFFMARDGGSTPVRDVDVEGGLVVVHWPGGVRPTGTPPVAGDRMPDRSASYLQNLELNVRAIKHAQVIAYTGCPGVMADTENPDESWSVIVDAYRALGFNGLCLDGVTEAVCRTPRGRQTIGNIAQLLKAFNMYLFVEARPDRALWDHLQGRVRGTVTLLSQLLREQAGLPGYEDLVPLAELQAAGCINYVWNDLPPTGTKFIDGVGSVSRDSHFGGRSQMARIVGAYRGGVLEFPGGIDGMLHSDTGVDADDVFEVFRSTAFIDEAAT